MHGSLPGKTYKLTDNYIFIRHPLILKAYEK